MLRRIVRDKLPFSLRAAGLALLSITSLTASSVFHVACGTTPRGVDWNGKRLPIVDMHLHPGDWDDIRQDTRKFLASRFPFPLGVDAASTAEDSNAAETILAELDSAGIWGEVFLRFTRRALWA